MLLNRIFGRISLLTLGATLIASAPAMAAPTDISLLKSLTKSEKSKRTLLSELKTELLGVALQRTEAISKSRGYPASLRSSNPLVTDYIRSELEKVLPGASLATEADRQRAVNLAMEILSGSVSEQALAYAAFQPTPKPPERWQTPLPLSASALVSTQRPLALDLSKSMVTEDKGTVGSNNGILDPGEKATLRLTFTNTSPRRLMSTSLYVRSLSECLFTSSTIGSEIEFPELEPNKSTTVNLNVYASSECAGKTGTIYMEARDTHEFPDAPLNYALRMPLSNATEATLFNVRIDRDDYGHSEPKTNYRIQPGDRVEVSASLALQGSGYSFAEQTVLAPTAAESASHQPGRVEFLTRQGKSIARMYDDLDLTFPSKTGLLAKLDPIAKAYGWKELNDAKVYVAIDTQFGTKGSPSTVTSSSVEPSYTFDSNALQRHLANHLHIEVNRTSTPPSKGRIAVGAVDGFRFEIDDPGPLMVKLQEIDLKVSQPKPPEPSSYRVRHYIELPIFWERVMNATCALSIRRSAITGQSIPVSLSFSDVVVGSRLKVSGMLLHRADHTTTTQNESETIQIGTVKMPSRSAEISLEIIDPEGNTICRDTRRVINNTPIAKAKPKPKPAYTPKKIDPRLPVATITFNGHMGGLGGRDVTGTIGRSVGIAASTGTIDGLSAWTLGPRATQLLSSDPDGLQFSLTESLEFGRRSGIVESTTEEFDDGSLGILAGDETVDGPYTRASIYLSAYRVIGVNIGFHLENDFDGNFHPSMRLGIGGFFGADY